MTTVASWIPVVLGIVLGLIGLLVVAWPIVRRGNYARLGIEEDAVQAERQRILERISDLNEEHSSGALATTDWEAQLDALQNRVTTLEAGSIYSGSDDGWESRRRTLIEQAVTERRAHHAATTPPTDPNSIKAPSNSTEATEGPTDHKHEKA